LQPLLRWQPLLEPKEKGRSFAETMRHIIDDEPKQFEKASPAYTISPLLSPPRLGAPGDERHGAGNLAEGSDCLLLSPFGVKEDQPSGRVVDLDAVEERIVQPAVSALGLTCLRGIARTEELFKHLWSAKIVVADLTTLSSTVSYHLGVRHGLRPSGTFVIAARGTPRIQLMGQFSRHFEYEPIGERIGGITAEQIERDRQKLTQAIKHLLESKEIDSPIYQVRELSPPYMQTVR
jgi:hypothetical protein